MNAKWQLRERALTLYCTGKYGSKEEATRVAKEQLKREVEKQKPQQDVSEINISFGMPNIIT